MLLYLVLVFLVGTDNGSPLNMSYGLYASCRVLTTDVPSDLVVEAGGLNFSLHKVPTVHIPILSPMQQLEIH